MNRPSQRVLVFCLSGLGDAVLASPALAALQEHPDRFQLTLLAMFPSVAEYLRDQQFTADVRHIPFLGMAKVQILAHAWRLRQERFDVTVLPYAMNRLGYNFFSRVVGARLRIGFRYQRQRWRNLPQLNNDLLDEEPRLHAVEENLRWARRLLGTDGAEIPGGLRYRVPSASVEAADRFLADQKMAGASPLVGVHAGCNSLKNQQNRLWPADRFAELIRRAAEEWPASRFVLFQGAQDVEINDAILARLGDARARVVVADRLPLRVVAALLRRCRVFVSNDSGLMHTAAACQVPAVSLFGPTNPDWVHPWMTRHIIVRRGLPCSPCFYYSSRPLRCVAHLDYACIREISVGEVFDALRNLLLPAPAETVTAPN